MRTLALLSLLVACRHDEPADGPDPVHAATVDRVELSHQSLLLAGVGDLAALGATALDADGEPIPGARITWTVADPAIAAATTDGRFEGLAVGSTTVVAEVDGVRSPAAVVWVANVTPGALLFDDDQLVDGPTPVDAGPAILGTRLSVVLDAVSPPAAGTVVLARQDAPVAGRVVSSAASGTGAEIELELVGLADLFVDLDFSLQDEAVAVPVPARRSEFSLGSFECETESTLGGGWPVPGLSASLTDTLTVDRDVQFSIESRTVTLAKVEVSGNLRLDVTGTLEFPLSWEGSLTCDREVGGLRFPFPGALALVAATKVPLGVGFVADGSFSATAVKYTASGTASVDLQAGFSYTPADGFHTISNVTSSHDLQVSWETPVLTEGATITAGVFPYLSAGLKVGPAISLSDDADLSLATLKAGVRREYTARLPADQVHDPKNASGYESSVHAELSAGGDLQALLEFFGLEVEAIEFDQPLDSEQYTSPKGTGSLSTDQIVAQEPVTVKAELEPATVNFTDGYNVGAVVVGKEQDGDVVPVAVIPAQTDGQTTFEWQWTPTAEDEAAGEVEFSFLVDTLEMPGVLLEIAPDSRQSIARGALPVLVRVGGSDCSEAYGSCIKIDPWPYLMEYLPTDTSELPVSLSLTANGVTAGWTLREEGEGLAFDAELVDLTGGLGAAQILVDLTLPGPGTLRFEPDPAVPPSMTWAARRIGYLGVPYETLISQAWDPGPLVITAAETQTFQMEFSSTAPGASYRGPLFHVGFTPDP